MAMPITGIGSTDSESLPYVCATMNQQSGGDVVCL
jgi:hypothetical protein